VLVLNKGKIADTAKSLGISLASVYRRVRMIANQE
jgi:transcriptional regulator of acetoin/glycerol metabolism